MRGRDTSRSRSSRRRLAGFLLSAILMAGMGTSAVVSPAYATTSDSGTGSVYGIEASLLGTQLIPLTRTVTPSAGGGTQTLTAVASPGALALLDRPGQSTDAAPHVLRGSRLPGEVVATEDESHGVEGCNHHE